MAEAQLATSIGHGVVNPKVFLSARSCGKCSFRQTPLGRCYFVVFVYYVYSLLRAMVMLRMVVSNDLVHDHIKLTTAVTDEEVCQQAEGE